MEVHNTVQEVIIKIIPKKKKFKKGKWLSEEALQIAEKRRETKGKGKKERYIHLNGIRHSPIPLQYSLQWQPTPVFLPGESHGWRSLVGCSPWGHTESDTTEAT